MRWRRGRSDLFHGLLAYIHTYSHKQTRKEFGGAENGLGDSFCKTLMYVCISLFYSTLLYSGDTVPHDFIFIEGIEKDYSNPRGRSPVCIRARTYN